MKELKLTHVRPNATSKWYWECPICFELLAPHPAGVGKVHLIFSSKGIATRHLIAHNAGYIPKKRSIDTIVSENRYFCNKCNAPVQSKKAFKVLYISDPPKWQAGHRFICVFCAGYLNWELGLKTRNEVHKGRTKNDGTMGR